MNLWWTEQQTPGLRLGLKCAAVLEHRRSPYQEVAVYASDVYGRMLTLDDMVMTTEADEFVYHEMLAHPGLTLCQDPRRVLVVGGGDGGTVREVCRHAGVRRVVLAELDPEVTAVCRRHLPSLTAALDDPRVELVPGDGVAYLAGAPPESFDVILVDAPDPIGPAEGLFGASFYASAERALAPGGVLVAQSESPFLHGQLIRQVQAAMRATFPAVGLYWAVVPTYPGAMWTFSMARRAPFDDPWTGERAAALTGQVRYWSPEVQRAAFVLPPFVRVLTEADA